MNASARLIYRAHEFCHITPLLAELHWLPVRSGIHYKILLITFKILHSLSPKYLSDFFEGGTTFGEMSVNKQAIPIETMVTSNS